MEEQERVGDLDRSIGYVIKQAQAALHAAMDEVLRPLDLTVAQYACLELLGQHPGLSNSELARRAFVARQSMNAVVLRLQERGLLTRPERASRGRALPTELTSTGQATLRVASVAARAVERKLFSPLSEAQQQRIREELATCVTSAPYG